MPEVDRENLLHVIGHWIIIIETTWKDRLGIRNISGFPINNYYVLYNIGYWKMLNNIFQT